MISSLTSIQIPHKSNTGWWINEWKEVLIVSEAHHIALFCSFPKWLGSIRNWARRPLSAVVPTSWSRRPERKRCLNTSHSAGCYWGLFHVAARAAACIFIAGADFRDPKSASALTGWSCGFQCWGITDSSFLCWGKSGLDKQGRVAPQRWDPSLICLSMRKIPVIKGKKRLNFSFSSLFQLNTSLWILSE